MTQIQIKIPINFKVKDTDKLKKDLIEYLQNHRKLKPVRFGYTTEYAESLEYGTGPLDYFQPTVHGGSYSYKTIYNEIYEWAGKKDGKGTGLPIKDPAERKVFAKNVTDKFFMFGMKPHPYWRPAIQFLQDNMQRLFDEGKSLTEICDEALRVANKCIMDQNMPFSGKLQQSAFIDTLNQEEAVKSKDLREYNDEERNRLFRESGWVDSRLKDTDGNWKRVKDGWKQ